MAKKLKWGTFSTDELSLDRDDDIFIDFPFLEFVGMEMNKVNEFSVGDNTVRGTKDTVSEKIVALSGSLPGGWDRTSWPIPFLPDKTATGIKNKKAFDRRHTLKVCRVLPIIKEVPSAEYKRVFPSFGGTINSFSDHSILTIAAMYGNVHGPTKEDTKEYMYEIACASILKDENDLHDEDLLTRDFVKRLLTYMGCYDRYNNNNAVVERIVTKILDSLRDPEKISGRVSQNINAEDLNKFYEESDEWQPHNTENDKYKFIMVPLQDNPSFCFTYAERILTTVCKNEAEAPRVTVEGTLPPKITRVLLWNGTNPDPQKIVASRQKFKKHLNSSWQTRRDNVLNPIESILNPTIVDSYRKKLSDLNMEIWCMNQLDDEDEPFEMCFEDEV
tara:strand:- start:1551 stop:2714 length:1164 start_codon:yes stop_codon:yes gene_type:complete